MDGWDSGNAGMGESGRRFQLRMKETLKMMKSGMAILNPKQTREEQFAKNHRIEPESGTRSSSPLGKRITFAEQFLFC